MTRIIEQPLQTSMRAALDSNTVEVGVFEQIEDVTMVIFVTIYQYLDPLQAYCCNQN
jgi:hypothetical protein